MVVGLFLGVGFAGCGLDGVSGGGAKQAARATGPVPEWGELDLVVADSFLQKRRHNDDTQRGETVTHEANLAFLVDAIEAGAKVWALVSPVWVDYLRRTKFDLGSSYQEQYGALLRLAELLKGVGIETSARRIVSDPHDSTQCVTADSEPPLGDLENPYLSFVAARDRATSDFRMDPIVDRWMRDHGPLPVRLSREVSTPTGLVDTREIEVDKATSWNPESMLQFQDQKRAETPDQNVRLAEALGVQRVLSSSTHLRPSDIAISLTGDCVVGSRIFHENAQGSARPSPHRTYLEGEIENELLGIGCSKVLFVPFQLDREGRTPILPLHMYVKFGPRGNDMGQPQVLVAAIPPTELGFAESLQKAAERAARRPSGPPSRSPEYVEDNYDRLLQEIFPDGVDHVNSIGLSAAQIQVLDWTLNATSEFFEREGYKVIRAPVSFVRWHLPRKLAWSFGTPTNSVFIGEDTVLVPTYHAFREASYREAWEKEVRGAYGALGFKNIRFHDASHLLHAPNFNGDGTNAGAWHCATAHVPKRVKPSAQ